MSDDRAAWGPLAERYRTPGPRRILALDGGGIRCSYGGVLDREVHDLIPADPQVPDTPLRLDVDTGKASLYVRYTADLTDAGLKELGVAGLDPHRLRKRDQVDDIGDRRTVGEALGERASLRHLGWAAA